MGATIPLGMYAIRRDSRLESSRSFSFLYLANVLGAVAGALVPLLLIELWGFTGTLQFGMVLNLFICFCAIYVATKTPAATTGSDAETTQGISSSGPLREMLGNSNVWLLFATGLTSMGMEVVWTRQFTLYVGTLVYSFASILGVYLAATFVGSLVYRWWSRKHPSEGAVVCDNGRCTARGWGRGEERCLNPTAQSPRPKAQSFGFIGIWELELGIWDFPKRTPRPACSRTPHTATDSRP